MGQNGFFQNEIYLDLIVIVVVVFFFFFFSFLIMKIYLALTNISFKDQIKVKDGWAHSLSILVSNFKNTWTEEALLHCSYPSG